MACQSLMELKIVVRCVLVACKNQLTVDELWKRATYVFGGPQKLQLNLFGYDTPFEFLQSVPDIVQLEDPEDTNSIVNLISSKLSRHMELLVSTNIIRPPKSKITEHNLFVPYRTQCAFIRIFHELYPEGLCISTFESDVLCIPIFRSYIDCVDILLSILDHIFIRRGAEMISLHPKLVIRLKEIIEPDDKYTAMDICNIDEYSLENSKADQQISNGLEYPLFNILEESIKTNIEQLLNEMPGWISDGHMRHLYIEKFGSAFNHYRRWGFSRISQMFSKLPELCCVHFKDDEVQIISSLKHTCDLYKNTNVLEEASESRNYSVNAEVNAKEKYDDKPNTNDGVLRKFLKLDPYLKTPLDDCFLEGEIAQSELEINSSLDVKICRIHKNFIPTITCQTDDQYHEFQKLSTDMKKFYFLHETELVFDPTITMVQHIYAYCFDDCWFRGLVIDVSLSDIVMMCIDNGSTHSIMFDDIRLLHKKFSQFPAQSLTCKLHGIDSVNDDELFKISDQKCTIYIVSTDQQNKCATVKIKLMDSVSDKYLNEEWIESGMAEPDSDDE